MPHVLRLLWPGFNAVQGLVSTYVGADVAPFGRLRSVRRLPFSLPKVCPFTWESEMDEGWGDAFHSQVPIPLKRCR